jgi:hypothetical protein
VASCGAPNGEVLDAVAVDVADRAERRVEARTTLRGES